MNTDTSPQPTTEKIVAGEYKAGVGLRFFPCSEDRDIEAYQEDLPDQAAVERFLYNWKSNFDWFSQYLNQSKGAMKDLVDCKHLALIVAVQAVIRLKQPGLGDDFRFCIQIIGETLVVWMDGLLTYELIRSSKGRLAFNALKEPPEWPAMDLDPTEESESPRTFRDDFEPLAAGLNQDFDVLRQGPWPNPSDEFLITGYFDYKSRTIRVDRSDEILTAFRNQTLPFPADFIFNGGLSLALFDSKRARKYHDDLLTALDKPQSLNVTLEPIGFLWLGLSLLADCLKDHKEKQDMRFSLRTWGRSVRVGLEGYEVLFFAVDDPGTDEYIVKHFKLPADFMPPLGPMPADWPLRRPPTAPKSETG